jgi:antirestriction protein
MANRKTDDGPRIYVADLAAYNSGFLHGAWIDANQDAEAIQGEIQRMLAASPVPEDAEEWAIHDYEGFGTLRLSESESMETVARVAALIEEHGTLFAEVVSHFGGTEYLDEALTAMEERYQGAHKSLEDWAYELAQDQGIECSEPYVNYIDWEKVGRDAELGGDVFTVETDDGMVHVFWAH